MNMVYRAYRFPYEWIPQVDPPKEIPIKAVAKAVPMDRLLTETDNPGGIKWLTGKPGMPLVISDVVRELANVKNTN